jgi:ferredoxin-NADP reductase
MLRTLCDEGFRGEVALLHYVRTAADLVYADELRVFAEKHANVTVRIAHTGDQAGDLQGRFTAEHLAAAAPWYANAETYVCGPASLMDAVHEHYAARGLDTRLHAESFTPPALVVDAADATGTVSFTRSDTSAENSGTTLLEQAEAAGLTPEYGCRMGICFSCTQVKRSGCTRNVLTGDLHTEPDEEIQLCISVPVGDVAVDI